LQWRRKGESPPETFVYVIYEVITNDVSDYVNILVRIAHIICNHPLYLTVDIVRHKYLEQVFQYLRICDPFFRKTRAGDSLTQTAVNRNKCCCELFLNLWHWLLLRDEKMQMSHLFILTNFLILGLFYDQKLWLYRAKHDFWIRKDVERSGHGLLKGTVPKFVWSNWGKPQNPSSGQLAFVSKFKPGTSLIRSRRDDFYRWARWLLISPREWLLREVNDWLTD